ncbi:ATP-binding protein [Psychrobacter sp. I-STPA6b]|uniref:ATP-binding protein n=1 Tax=Psychrobacter sp. I-STPA6b TaxID=2585718 RepID=UPI001D0CAF1D|nr:ATP-binding protein [Psychrobacter sp. I-STPA6b]
MDTNIKNEGGRYRGLVISIAIFLALIGALLAYTFYTSNLIQRNTALIYATNKVDNDAQSVIKDIFDLQNSYGEDINSPHMQTVLQRLKDNSNEIDQLLTSIHSGGLVTLNDGKQYRLPIITDTGALANLTQAQNEWNYLKPKVDDYLAIAGDIRKDSSTQLAIVGEQAKVSSLQINESLQDLSQDIFTDAANQANNIRLIQLLGVGGLFAYFLIFIFVFVRRLRETDAEVALARRETQEIMETVNTGLFLLDKNLHIGQQHSKALADIIGSNRLAGEDFTQVLRGRISEKDLNTTRQFIEQLYNPRVKEKLVDDLNPLHKVMLHNDASEMSQGNRYLDFKFSRVYENKEIARILVNVMDVSDAVKLEQRLEQERAQNDMQIEMLTTILNVNPSIIQEFIVNTKEHVEKINNVLKNPGSSQFELENKLNLIYREMHSLKGEASALKLHSFTKIASAAEDKLQALQNQGKLNGNDFLPLAVDLDELLNLSNTIELLGERINQTAPASANNVASQGKPAQVKPAVDTVTQSADVGTTTDSSQLLGKSLTGGSQQGLLDCYQDFSQQIANRQNKKIRLQAPALDSVTIPANLASTVREIIIQLLRNAIVHGIEEPQAREAAGKETIGTVILDVHQEEQNLVVMVQDDGAGINYEGIRQKIIETGKLDKEVAQKLNKNQLLNVLFSSGFTTKEHADEDGGRGVGLDIIKDRVQSHKGKLNVQSHLGEMTRFSVSLPITQ